MSEAALLGGRQVRRIAEGLPRARLISPVVSARPRLLAIWAPAGYGKSVLAAQIASCAAFDEVRWIDAVGDQGSVLESFAALAKSCGAGDRLTGLSEVSELAALCAAEISALRDDTRIAVVFDDIGWHDDELALDLVRDVALELPDGSTFILTCRGEISAHRRDSGCWRIGPRDLLLTDDELAGMWARLGSGGLVDSDLRRLVEASGRHAALASLVIRERVLAGSDSFLGSADGDLAAVLGLLVEQLTEEQRLVLHAAAVLGQGAVASLDECIGSEGAGPAIGQVAAVLPLVSVSGRGQDARFRVHSIVAEAIESIRRLSCEPSLLSRLVGVLGANRQYARAIEVAVASRRTDLIAEALAAVDDPLIVEAHAEWLRSVLTRVAPSDLAGNPSLLLMAAQLYWEDYEPTSAIRTAQLAARLAEHCGDEPSQTRARILGLRMKSAAGELEGAAAEVRRLLPEARARLCHEDLAVVALSGVMTFGLMGDRNGLRECLEIERELRRASGVSALTRFRMDTARGLVSAVFDGSYSDAVTAFRRALSQPLLLPNTAAIGAHNLSAALLETGKVDEALAAAGPAAPTSTVETRSMVSSLHAIVTAAVEIVHGRESRLREVGERAYDEAIGDGDWLSAATVLHSLSTLAVMAGDVGYARTLGERGVEAAMRTGSTTLLWKSELLQAQSALLAGDSASARATALRLLPTVEAAGAHGHILHARMILSECALRANRLAEAVENLSVVGERALVDQPHLALSGYMRAFPDLLGPFALAIGVDRVPDALLDLIPDAARALALASTTLSPKEHVVLETRIRSRESRSGGLEGVCESPICRVRLFGGLQVAVARGQVSDRDWAKRKARLLFAMLVSRSGTDVPRGEIIEYLWPNMEEERALNNFYVVWSAMKRALSPESVRDTPCPFVEQFHGVCRTVKGRVVSDLDEFAELVSAARTARQAGDTTQELVHLRAIAELYRGEVLPGDVYDDWFAPLRDRFRHDFEDAMLRAAEILAEQRDPHSGLQMLRRAMVADPWREDLYQAQLRLQIEAGQRSAAIETYMACRARLTEDLGIDPSRETTSLYEQVLGMEERGS